MPEAAFPSEQSEFPSNTGGPAVRATVELRRNLGGLIIPPARANQAARLLRAAVSAVVTGDAVDARVAQRLSEMGSERAS